MGKIFETERTMNSNSSQRRKRENGDKFSYSLNSTSEAWDIGYWASSYVEVIFLLTSQRLYRGQSFRDSGSTKYSTPSIPKSKLKNHTEIYHIVAISKL